MQAVTRRTLHAIGETILAGPQHRLTGTIRLYAAPGGFRTGPLGAPDRFMAVRGIDLVVSDATGERVVPLRGTLRDVAQQAGVDFGAPVDVYPQSAQPPAPTDQVLIDPDVATAIARAIAMGDEAGRLFSEMHAPGGAVTPVLWPEHFDIGVTVDDVNYGVSTGDDLIPEPYAYVGPHEVRRGAFWDQPFGATRLVQDLDSVPDLLAFFEQGRAHAAQDPAS
ncbi:MAG: hypothetical protein ABI912_02525 [Actinomycetota bacterium]